jgi:hypothetical protein
MLDLILALLANPFDPANNVALFSAFDRLLPQPTERLLPEDPDAAWRVLCRVRGTVERSCGAGWQWPEEQAFKTAWPTLTPRARWLVLWHDALHATHGIEQDAAGEYELAVRLLTMPSRWFRSSAMPSTLAGLHRVYGALALATLPVGMARAGTAPLRGALAGLLAPR